MRAVWAALKHSDPHQALLEASQLCSLLLAVPLGPREGAHHAPLLLVASQQRRARSGNDQLEHASALSQHISSQTRCWGVDNDLQNVPVPLGKAVPGCRVSNPVQTHVLGRVGLVPGRRFHYSPRGAYAWAQHPRIKACATVAILAVILQAMYSSWCAMCMYLDHLGCCPSALPRMVGPEWHKSGVMSPQAKRLWRPGI